MGSFRGINCLSTQLVSAPNWWNYPPVQDSWTTFPFASYPKTKGDFGLRMDASDFAIGGSPLWTFSKTWTEHGKPKN